MFPCQKTEASGESPFCAIPIPPQWHRDVLKCSFEKNRLKNPPGAAIRFALDDERIDSLVIGMRLRRDIDANIKTLSGDLAYTADDRALLSEFSALALESKAIKKMRID